MTFNASGSKYLRDVPCAIEGRVDTYAVMDAFSVTCPARQHAIKKLLCAGIRGKGDELQDLNEARDAITRAIQMAEQKRRAGMKCPKCKAVMVTEQDESRDGVVKINGWRCTACGKRVYP